VGVDVFFVISGYLITTIIMNDIEQGKFSIFNFYERRARRILPALFAVMLVTLAFGYIWMMPDEFKNLGQSLVATALFSNNILLGITSGYWDLASEFKPLLHTWSLGVEEQYYVIVPVLLMAFWKIGRKSIPYLLLFIFTTSLLFASWFVDVSPNWAFYILPTRAWEICIGALAAIYLIKSPSAPEKNKYANFLSTLGILLIAFSIFSFDNSVPSPGIFLLIPNIGAILIIIFCKTDSIAFRILGSRFFVFIGLMSYSLYLWHQPVFAYLRVYSPEQPSPLNFMTLLPLVLLLSYLTWRFVEKPFRNRSFIGGKLVFIYSAIATIFFVTVGLWLNKSYGMAWRVFDTSVSIADMDKRIYNERIFLYKKDQFSDANKKKILIIGTSFARDFTNITLENFDVSRAEIVYRDDLTQCIETNRSPHAQSLFADADVIVFASGGYDKDCVAGDFDFAQSRSKDIFYVGMKNFGYNLNWLIRLDKDKRINRSNTTPETVINTDKEMDKAIPDGHFISFLKPTLVDGKIPITDEFGRMLSTDRAHLTKYGALYFGKRAVAESPYSNLFK